MSAKTSAAPARGAQFKLPAKRRIALLRGVNVGGKNKLPMADLRGLCEQLGFANVKSYIQSGNLIFDATATPQKLEKQLRSAIQAQFSLDIPVLVLKAQELVEIESQVPWPKLDCSHLHACLLSPAPNREAKLTKVPVAGEEKCELVGRVVYLHCPHGYAGTKLTNTFFEKQLGVHATTRNWRTVHKLIDLASSQ